MKSIALPMILFACFAVGLPTWLMQNNAYSIDRVHSCTGECYERWVAETGGVVAVARAEAAEAAAAIAGKLLRYSNGETVGPQSNLMWGQAAALSDKAISDVAEFIATF